MPGQLTKLYAAYKEGNRAAVDALIPIVYDELRRIARALKRLPPGHYMLAYDYYYLSELLTTTGKNSGSEG